MKLNYAPRQKQLETLIQKLGLPENAPVKWSLLDLALTHPSISPSENYDQLEFVGDAVVRLAASEMLMETYPELAVGEYSAIRQVLVSDRIMAELGSRFGLDRYLLIENRSTQIPPSAIADTFEAIVGALYLSTHNMKLVRPWLDPLFQNLAVEILKDPARQNYKYAFQEWAKTHYKVLPEYRVETSKENNPLQRFTASVWLQNRQMGKGTGQSKKAAEQAAAKQAFESVSTIPN